MKTLEEKSKAPQIELPLLGGGKFSLEQSLAEGRVLLAFFKVSCPVCQYAFPFLERLHKRTRGRALKVVGISQDDAKSTELFRKEFGVTFEIALEDLGRYAASNAYGLSNVPSIFLVGQNGLIVNAVVGWSKRDLDEINSRYQDSANARLPLFEQNEDVAEFRAG